jgi:TIR domain
VCRSAARSLFLGDELVKGAFPHGRWDVPNLSSQGVFLSYRREDAAPYARMLKDELSRRISDARVFMDLDSIEAGVDFAEVIRDTIESSAVLVALIGRQWAVLSDEGGRRRLDDPDDYVRLEIQSALERDVRVIPVLVDGAKPPRQQQLPAELQKLARLNAFELSNDRYQYDRDRLVTLIQGVLAGESSPGTGHQPPSPDTDAATVTRPGRLQPEEIPEDEAAQEHVEPVRSDRAQATRVLAEAERIAYSITDDASRAAALAAVAKALKATDPDRATRLAAEADDMAQSFTDQGPAVTVALANLAVSLAAIDTVPDRAERVVRSIIDPAVRASALADLAVSFAATDPEDAARLTADAQDIAEGFTDETQKAWTLADVAGVLAAADPDRAGWLIADAERIARSITDEGLRVRALADVARALIAADPERADWVIADAEQIAQSMSYEPWKASALAQVASALAAADPERAARLIADAEQITQPITDEFSKGTPLADIAKATGDLARALAAADPDRATQLIADAERIARSISEQSSVWKAVALADLARALAATAPGRAERIARSIADEDMKASALCDIAVALAATDSRRAEYIARSITDKVPRVKALAAIAEAASKS